MQDTQYIVDSIQAILDDNKGFVATSSLLGRMSRELRDMLGFKSNTPTRIIMRKLGTLLEENFVIRKKSNAKYIMTPCDPADLLLGVLSEKKPMTTGELVRAVKPFLKSEVIVVLNELIESGRVKVKFDGRFFAQIYSAGKSARIVDPEPIAHSGEYTREAFKAAYDELKKFRDFPRVPDLRRKLNWPRGVFDEMVRSLRDDGTVQLERADESMMTSDEIQDCFVSEKNNIRMGLLIWNGR